MTAFSARPGDPISVDVRPALCPDGKQRVLLQLPDGFILIPPDDARHIAGLLLDAARSLEEQS